MKKSFIIQSEVEEISRLIFLGSFSCSWHFFICRFYAMSSSLLSITKEKKRKYESTLLYSIYPFLCEEVKCWLHHLVLLGRVRIGLTYWCGGKDARMSFVPLWIVILCIILRVSFFWLADYSGFWILFFSPQLPSFEPFYYSLLSWKRKE